MSRFGFAFCFIMLAFLTGQCKAAAQNVTTLLDKHPQFSTFNRLLSDYGVAPHINSRTTITVLCPPNSVLNVFLVSRPDAQLLYDILSFHVLLEYVDPSTISNSISTFTTLFQTTGLATSSDSGYLNISLDHASGQLVARLSGLSIPIGDPLESFPYNITVLPVAKVLVPPGMLTSPAPPPVNITQLLAQSGKHGKFLELLLTTGVLQVFQNHVFPPGLTILAPTDAAFGELSSKLASKLSTLPLSQKVALLEGHALPCFYSEQELSVGVGPFTTLSGGSIFISHTMNITAGSSKAAITGTLASSFPVSIVIVDHVLLSDYVLSISQSGASTSPSPSQSPESSASSSTVTPSPSLSLTLPPLSPASSSNSSPAESPSETTPTPLRTPASQSPLTPTFSPPVPVFVGSPPGSSEAEAPSPEQSATTASSSPQSPHFVRRAALHALSVLAMLYAAA